LVSGFEPKDGLEPFRLPSSPKPLEDVVNTFFEGDEHEDVDPVELWNRANTDLVLSCGWDGGPGGSSSWSLWAMTLPSRRRVYVQSPDWDGDSVLCATPPTFTPDVDDVRLLRLLAVDNGSALDTGVIGSIPDEFRVGPKIPKDELITIVAALLAHSDADLRDRVDCSERTSDRKVVEQWLRDRGVLK